MGRSRVFYSGQTRPGRCSCPLWSPSISRCGRAVEVPGCSSNAQLRPKESRTYHHLKPLTARASDCAGTPSLHGCVIDGLHARTPPRSSPAMEPPAKKRRQGQSPFDPSGGDDDDELFFEPHEIRAKRDPGYKLSLERAYADNRFQATMAHIFEKYSRDFEGVGDEIDMVTGEIVVNNGHLQNMRNEVDVGLTGPEDGVDDDDEGILLEDLLDEDVIGKDTRHYEEGPEGEDEDEEDRIIQGQELGQHSTALVPASHNHTTALESGYPSLLSGTFPGASGGFDPAAAFGASPLAFGTSPFAMDPWGLPSLFSGPSWEPPDIFPRQPKLLPSAGDRYSFPVQDGGSSIWAPNYRFKDDEPDRAAGSGQLGPPKPPGRTRTRPMKYLLPPNATRTEDDADEEVDEDAILSGKPTQHEISSKPADANQNLEDDPLNDAKAPTIAERRATKSTKRRDARAAATPATSSTVSEKSKVQTSTTGTSPGAAVEQPLQTVPEPVISKPQPETASEAASPLNDATDDQEQSLRIQSGRTQNRVDPVPNISRSDVIEERQPQRTIMVEIPAIPPPNRDEYEEFNDLAEEVEEVADSQDEAPPTPEQDVADGTGVVTIAQPDLAALTDTPAPHGGNASHKQAHSSRGQKSRRKETRQEPSQLFTLSDDELPVFTRPTPPSILRGSKRTITRASSSELHDSGLGDSAATFSSTEQDEQDHEATASSSAADGKRPSRRESSRAVVLSDKETQTKPTRRESAVPGVGSSGDSTPRSSLGEQLNLSGSDPSTAAPKSLSTKPRSRSRRSKVAVAPAGAKIAGQEGATEQQPVVDAMTGQRSAPPASTIHEEPQTLPDNPATIQPLEHGHGDTAQTSPTKPTPAKATPSKPPATPSKPHTPRHTSIPTARAPSSRRSILSLLSADDDADDDDEKDLDELGRAIGASGLPAPFLSSGAPSSRKIWKSSARTTEIYHTPIKRRPTDMVSPSSIIRTPGGTKRTCGLDGYRCGRDFCFTCL